MSILKITAKVAASAALFAGLGIVVLNAVFQQDMMSIAAAAGTLWMSDVIMTAMWLR